MAKKIGYDLGHKVSEDISEPSLDKNKICYPKIYLTDKELPLLEELEVGDKVSFLCLFKVSSKSENENENEKEKRCEYSL